jgi:hypothetical protein
MGSKKKRKKNKSSVAVGMTTFILGSAFLVSLYIIGIALIIAASKDL